MSDVPFVSILMPVRDEGRSIDAAVSDLLGQDWPRDRLELIVADGRSRDDTRVILEEWGQRDGRLRWIDNPGRIVPTGLNRAIEEARGTVLVRADGHTRYASDYVRTAVAALRRTGADVVGGPMRPEGRGAFGRAVAAAHTSALGVGGSSFHFADRAGPAQAVYLGVFRADAFRRFGVFDEYFVRNQDDEWFYRAGSQGARIVLDPAIRSTYQPRETVAALFRQYFGYGRFKPAVLRKSPRGLRLRHLAPPALVCTLIAAVVLPWFEVAGLRSLAWGSMGAVAAYAALLTIGSWKARARANVAQVAFACATMHVAYGLGMLRGLWSRAPESGRRAIGQAYERYARDAQLQRKWSENDPGQRALLRERDAALVDALQAALGDRLPTARILDLGAGSRDLADVLAAAGLTCGGVISADLLVDRLRLSGAAARVAADGRRLPFSDGAFDAVVQCTMLSSVVVPATRRVVAAEMDRVCREDGVLCSYDASWPNPWNRQVRRLGREECRSLFPERSIRFHRVTALPPLARRWPKLAHRLPRWTHAFDLAVVRGRSRSASV